MKPKNVPQTPAETRESLPDDLRAAYQAHTLAQMLTMRLAGTPRWTPVAQPPFPTLLH